MVFAPNWGQIPPSQALHESSLGFNLPPKHVKACGFRSRPVKKSNRITDHTCFHMRYRKSETNDDAYTKTETWNCDTCHTDKVIVKEIPIPTEKAMLVKLLMSLGEKYELEGSTVAVCAREVRATFRFPEHDLPKLRDIADKWAERGYINAKHLLMLEKAGMQDVMNIPPRWAPSKREARRETMRRVFGE